MTVGFNGVMPMGEDIWLMKVNVEDVNSVFMLKTGVERFAT